MEKHYESDEIEIDLKELFFEVVGEWKMIVVSTVLVGLIMFLISNFIITPQYQSTSRLYVFTKSTSITSLADLQTSSNLTSDYKEVIGSRPVLDKVIENLDLDIKYGELAQMLALTNPSNSRILEITATHPDPEAAKAIADEVADVAAQFISDKMDQDPPSVLQYGYVAEGPVSPNVIKNTVIGALAGAFLAIAIVVITYLLNDTIMTPDDMERKVGLNVLASLPFDEEEDDGIPVRKEKKKSVLDIKKPERKNSGKGSK